MGINRIPWSLTNVNAENQQKIESNLSNPFLARSSCLLDVNLRYSQTRFTTDFPKLRSRDIKRLGSLA